jgi:LmbE family N-acetylglucosaminyl deacetylase
MPTQRRVALSLLAHPDDAEILCGGTLIRLRQEHGYEVHIVTCTAGDCGTTSKSPWEISSIRTNENAASAKLIGATYHCLGLFDGVVCYNRESVQKASNLFRQVNPTLVFSHPRHDYMPDHEQAHLIARMATFLYAAPNASDIVPVPADAHVPHLYYCDPLEGIDPYSGEAVTPHAYVDVAKVHELKLKMLACHASQREWLRAHHGMDEYLDAVKRHDEKRGSEAKLQLAEAFTQHRGHGYPRNDLLKELLGGKQ